MHIQRNNKLMFLSLSLSLKSIVKKLIICLKKKNVQLDSNPCSSLEEFFKFVFVNEHRGGTGVFQYNFTYYGWLTKVVLNFLSPVKYNFNSCKFWVIWKNCLLLISAPGVPGPAEQSRSRQGLRSLPTATYWKKGRTASLVTLDNSHSIQSTQKIITHRTVNSKVVSQVNDTKVLRH